MKLIVAKNAGACYGVNRSLEIVKKIANEDKKVCTLGELIHNPIVVEELSTKYNISSIDDVDSALSSGVESLVIRSHGVAIDVVKKAEKNNIEIIDATCPYVKNVQTTASILAGLYPAVIIVGKNGHPEVESVSSYICAQGSKCFILETKEEVDEYIDEIASLNDSIGLVSQTTQSGDTFDMVVEYIKSKGINLEIENTICAATKKRQTSALSLSKEVDAMLVIGGKNSSNTTHLVDLCKKNCARVYHIEVPEEIEELDLSGVKTLGLSAGASTPKDQIDTVIDFINKKFN